VEAGLNNAEVEQAVKQLSEQYQTEKHAEFHYRMICFS